MTSQTPMTERESSFAADAELRDDKIDLLKIVAMFTAEWRTGVTTMLVIFCLGAVLILRMPSQYEATAVILPKDQTGGGNSLTAIFTGSRPSSSSASLLVSRTVKNEVIRRADLMTYFKVKSQEAARGGLSGMTKILPGADTITIQVRDRNAAVAARVANAYVDSLRAMQETMASAESDLQRHYFEQQLQREKMALAKAEEDLQTTEQGSGVVQVDTQTQIGLNAIANARAQVTTLQVRLAALLQSETEQNPEVKTLRSQIAQLQAQERTLETGASGGAGVAAPAGKMASVNLEVQRRLREVRYHEALVTSLSNHFEDLRVGSATLGDSFDLIDQAVTPEFPTWPPRRLFLLLAMGVGLVTGLIAIAIRLVMLRVLRDPQQRAYLSEIRQQFRRGA